MNFLIPRSQVLFVIIECVKRIPIEFLMVFYKRKHHNKALVKQFFELRSSANNFSDFTESTSTWYITPVVSIIKQQHFEKNIKMLDLGCGRGGLINAIIDLDYSIKYLGIDFDSIAISKCIEKYKNLNNFSFKVLDISEKLPENEEKYDIITAINILPYLNDLHIFSENLLKLLGDTGKLLIVDPHPGLYWDDVFGGFSIAIRNPNEIKKILASNGLKCTNHETLFTLELGGKGILPISSIITFEKSLI